MDEERTWENKDWLRRYSEQQDSLREIRIKRALEDVGCETPKEEDEASNSD
jgi:hypothetical protein